MKHLHLLSASAVRRFHLGALILGLASGACVRAGDLILVESQTAPGKPWTNQPTRVLSSLPETIRPISADELSVYGGWKARTAKATGFFYPIRQDGRWWLVDPEGCLFLHKGIAAVAPLQAPAAEAALQRRFTNETGWAEATVSLMRSNGFNGLGAWSAAPTIRRTRQPMVYTRIWNFMQTYGYRRGGVYQKSGHVGYPSDCIFVFDPEFETFCDEHARKLAEDRDDPWLLGHFSDNEMPLRRQALDNYLGLPAGDPGNIAAWTWLRERHGADATAKSITAQDRRDFLALITDRYFRIVSKAIRKYDPNHLFLGSRFHGGELDYPEVFKAAGAYLDVVAVNYYRTWTPSIEKIGMWSEQSGRPVLITEWYVKGEDSGMPNTSGAGWIVRTQRDRGHFYQHFVLGLLESRAVVGWDWFKYIDNDPANLAADPSNRDSNKGIVNNRYVPYPDLLDAMKQLNDRAYGLTGYFDRRPVP